MIKMMNDGARCGMCLSSRKTHIIAYQRHVLRDWYSMKYSRVFCFYTGKKPVQKIKLFLRYVYTNQKIKITMGQFDSILISSIHDVEYKNYNNQFKAEGNSLVGLGAVGPSAPSLCSAGGALAPPPDPLHPTVKVIKTIISNLDKLLLELF